METVESLQAQIMAAAGVLSALIGEEAGSILGGWTVSANLATAAQVSAAIGWVNGNVPNSPERAELLSKLTELLNLLENVG